VTQNRKENMNNKIVPFTLAALIGAGALPMAQAQQPHNMWIEAEHIAPLSGANFSFQPLDA